MPTMEDDFGKVERRKFTATWHPGECTPRHGLGTTLREVRPESPATTRKILVGLPVGCMDVGAVHHSEGFSARRHRGAVADGAGQELCKNAASAERTPRGGKRTFDFVPSPKKTVEEQSKRCFDWTHRPTGYENMDQWEDPPNIPGVRPTAPVSITGPVSLVHRRNFPELQYGATACPGEPRKSELPGCRSEVGGWAKSGAPGRRPLVSCWDSLEPQLAKEGADVMERFGDARRRPFPEREGGETAQLTRWHLDPRADVNPIVRKQIIVNTPREDLSSASAVAAVRLPAAGKRTGAAREGAALYFYDRVRAAEAAEGPHTAR